MVALHGPPPSILHRERRAGSVGGVRRRLSDRTIIERERAGGMERGERRDGDDGVGAPEP